VCCLFAHLLVCISQEVLELVSGDTGAFLFSQYNMAVEKLCMGWGFRVLEFCFFLVVFSDKFGSSV
jgi:hypothetical protein